MRAKILCLVLVLFVVNCLAAELSVQQEWDKFKTSFQKSYSPEEEARRFQIFQENFQKINAHNDKYARGESTFTQGINQFADLSADDFKAGVSGFKPGKTKSGKPRLGLPNPIATGRPSDPVARQPSLGSVSPSTGNVLHPQGAAQFTSSSQLPTSYSSQIPKGSGSSLQSRFGDSTASAQGSAVGSYSSQSRFGSSQPSYSRSNFGNPGLVSPWAYNSNLQNSYVAPQHHFN